MKRHTLLPLLLAIALTGCFGGGTSEPSSTTSSSTTSTTAPTTTTTTTTLPPTTTTVPPTTSTTKPPVVYSVANHRSFPDPLSGSQGAHGSGCVVGGDNLPDGIWFGFIRSADASKLSIDVACFWTGQLASVRAAANGDEAVDFYVENQNPKVRSVPRSSTGTAYWLDKIGAPETQATPMANWPNTSAAAFQECPGEYCAVWLFVNGGSVTELVEQYLP